MGPIIIFWLRRDRDSPWAASKALVPLKGPFSGAGEGLGWGLLHQPGANLGTAVVELPETPRLEDFQLLKFTWAQDGAVAGEPNLCLESKSQKKVTFHPEHHSSWVKQTPSNYFARGKILVTNFACVWEDLNTL